METNLNSNSIHRAPQPPRFPQTTPQADIADKKLFNKEDAPDIEKKSMNMITVDRAAAEEFMMALKEAVEDVQVLKNLIEDQQQDFQSQTLTKFNALIDSTAFLNKQLESSQSYEKYLEEKIENGRLTKEVGLLELQLQKEKAQLSEFIIKIDNFLTMKVNELGDTLTNIKSLDDKTQQVLGEFKKETAGIINRSVSQIENSLDETSKSLTSGAENQFQYLKTQAETVVKALNEKCINILETIKRQSIDFLKQCEAENKKLIEKVPAVADRKISKKDIFLMAISSLAVASLLMNLFM